MSFEESITATIVEKQRSNKNRNVAKLDQATPISQRYGPHFIKTTFLIDRCHVMGKPSHEELKLLRAYDELAKKYSSVDWQVNEDALDACLMSKEEKKIAICREKNATISTEIVGCDAAKPIQSCEFHIDSEFVQQRRRKRVLVPISCGITSLATLWWCLLQDYDVYLCYAFDALSYSAQNSENSFEIQCLLRLLQYLRRKDGTLLFETTDKGGGIHQLSRSEIHQRIKIIQVPLSSYFLKKQDDLLPHQYSLKAHPQAYLLLYRQILMVAQSLNCSAIAFGMYDDAKNLLQAACPMFTAIYKHELLFPFTSRNETLESFHDAAEQSWNVWKSFGLEKDNISGIWQTAGPSLMPNLAHYVTTCQTRPQTMLEKNMLKAEEKALASIQKLIEMEEHDTGQDTSTKGKKKRATDPFQHAQYLTTFTKELEKIQDFENDQGIAFNFCGKNNCIDCWLWRKTLKNQTKRDTARSKWQNLASEYCARLRANFIRKKAASNIIVKNTSKKRELTLADLTSTNRAKKPRLEEMVDEEEDEEIDELFDDEDHADSKPKQDEDEEAAILVDEEIEGDEEENDAEEKEKDEDEDEDEDDDADEDDEDDEDDDDDDDDDDDGGGEDY